MFDVRSGRLLAPGTHLSIDACPGLRLVTTKASSARAGGADPAADRRAARCTETPVPSQRSFARCRVWLGCSLNTVL